MYPMEELSPEAVWVRDAVVELQGWMSTGDARWPARLEEVTQRMRTISDPVSADDALARVTLLRAHAAQLHGDAAAALAELQQADAAVTRQLTRVDGAESARRLADHRWVIRFNRAQVLQAVGDFDEAARLGRLCLDDAEATLDPPGRHRHALVLDAATALARQDYAAALTGYRDAVHRFRTEEPESVGIVLLGLAQAEMVAGQLEAAARTAERAAPLLGDDQQAQLSLQQLRAQLDMQTSLRAAAASMDRFADAVDEAPAGHSADESREQADEARTRALHLAGRLEEGAALAQRQVAAARHGTDRQRLANALIRLAALTQDRALTEPNRSDGEPLHHAALAALEEAEPLLDDLGLVLQRLRVEATIADYVSQWHQVVDGTNVQLLHRAMQQAAEAAEALDGLARDGATAPDRRDLAATHAQRAHEVAFDLAFRVGAKEILAGMIERRAAGTPASTIA